jgi:hypothetical protein
MAVVRPPSIRSIDRGDDIGGGRKPISKELPPPVEVLCTYLCHAKRIFFAALVDPALKQVNDPIVFRSPLHEGALGVD